MSRPSCRSRGPSCAQKARSGLWPAAGCCVSKFQSPLAMSRVACGVAASGPGWSGWSWRVPPRRTCSGASCGGAGFRRCAARAPARRRSWPGRRPAAGRCRDGGRGRGRKRNCSCGPAAGMGVREAADAGRAIQPGMRAARNANPGIPLAAPQRLHDPELRLAGPLAPARRPQVRTQTETARAQHLSGLCGAGSPP